MTIMVNNLKELIESLLQRISSDWSEQSKSPSHTAVFGMHSPFMQVASLTPQAVGGRVVGSATEQIQVYINDSADKLSFTCENPYSSWVVN